MANHLSYDVLSRLVERRASPVDARAQRHLAGCGRCRSELAWLERIRRLPQHTTELGEADRATESVGDGWGNINRRPAAGDQRDFEGASMPRTQHVSAYWLGGADRSHTRTHA